MKKFTHTVIQGDQKLINSISDWELYFKKNTSELTKICFIAQGGTIDSIKNEVNKLVPSSHPVTIQKSRILKAFDLAALFEKHKLFYNTLKELYAWTDTQAATVEIPWVDLKLGKAMRISSFDSGQEEIPHFVAALLFITRLLNDFDTVILSQGTDSLVNKAALFSVTLSPYLYASKKKVIFIGSSESGYIENSLAIINILSGLYTSLETFLPGGVYIVSSERYKNENISYILPGLGSVKLHADGYFHAPNSGPLLVITKSKVFKTGLYDDLSQRIKNIGLLPYLLKFYLKDSSIKRLEEVFKLTAIETVDNDARILDHWYKLGKRVFLIKARGAGNASETWKHAISKVAKRKDTTVMIITSADSGDVHLNKYEAGIDLPRVLSGRTLREEAGFVLAAISHDLAQNERYSFDDLQQLIERYCYLSGMVSV